MVVVKVHAQEVFLALTKLVKLGLAVVYGRLAVVLGKLGKLGK